MQSIHRMMETESLTEGLHSKYWFRSWTIQIFLCWPPSAAYAYGVILHLITSFFTVLDAKNLLRTCIIVVYGGSSWGFKLITSRSLVPSPLLVSSLMPNELHQWSCLEHKICCWCHPNCVIHFYFFHLSFFFFLTFSSKLIRRGKRLPKGVFLVQINAMSGRCFSVPWTTWAHLFFVRSRLIVI